MEIVIATFLGSAAGILLLAIISGWVMKPIFPNKGFWSRMIYAAPIAGLMACFISYLGTIDGESPGSESHMARWIPMVVSYIIAAMVWWFVALFAATPSSGKKIIHTSDTDD